MELWAALRFVFPRQKTVSAGPGLEFSGVGQPGPQVPNIYQASLAAPSAARPVHGLPAPKVWTPLPTEYLNQKHVPDRDIAAIPTALLAEITLTCPGLLETPFT